ncbi:uncharacterized protein LOC143914008 isoform X1 [Arctopsyche grandis]|uniref:uncharacterized protein LOC143914008 isoform X1 n=1 Tax=Arctopsyche grandis TaxID=121162 RepID=UPI00406D6ED9
MRRRPAGRRSEEESSVSEMADEPEDFNDSGEDWTPDAAPPAPGGGRGGGRKRAIKPVINNTQKKKRKKSTSEESEPEDEEVEPEEGDEDVEDESDEDKNGSDGNKSDSEQSKDVPKHYHSGNFVLLKSDVKWDGGAVTSKLEDLFLWKIDGKALLQKYVPMASNGKTLHKCTCVYSGWNVDHRENYYPITEILDKNPKTDTKEICVALNLDDLVKVKDKH